MKPRLGYSPSGTLTASVSRAVAWDLGPTPSKAILIPLWKNPRALVVPMTFSLVNGAILCPTDITLCRYVPGLLSMRSNPWQANH